jgi:hypothetical protein
MQLAHYLGLVHRAEQNLADAYDQVTEAHRDEPDVAVTCELFAQMCQQDATHLRPFAERYGEEADDEPDRLHSELFHGTRTGALALVRDLHDLYLMVSECAISWTMIEQAAQGARDTELLALAKTGDEHAQRQLTWVRSRMKQAAPQVLVVA